MKSCPVCKRRYEDDTQSFCFDDGAALDRELGETETVFLPKTLVSPTASLSPPLPKAGRSGNIYVVLTGLVLVLVVGGLMLLGFFMRDEGKTGSDQQVVSHSTASPSPSPRLTPSLPAKHGKVTTLSDALRTYKYDVGWNGNSEYSPITRIIVDGYNVEIHYAFKNGVIKGTIGTKEIYGSWQQSNGSGTIELYFTDDFQSASGTWDQSDHSHSGGVTLRSR